MQNTTAPKRIDGETFKTLAALKDALSGERRQARAEARRDYCGPFFFDRERELIAFDAAENRVEPVETWNGTATQLRRFIVEAAGAGAVRVIVSGGFDSAESPNHYRDGDYQPWAGEYDVAAWNAPEGGGR